MPDMYFFVWKFAEWFSLKNNVDLVSFFAGSGFLSPKLTEVSSN